MSRHRRRRFAKRRRAARKLAPVLARLEAEERDFEAALRRVGDSIGRMVIAMKAVRVGRELSELRARMGVAQ